ncbi:MAG: gliding motility-associated C-terminal domain-containing protein [Flavobacteriales bacterium]|nr:gliding motility-associated C-terminal domain-containing protein [Flavobacteriales bacterium]
MSGPANTLRIQFRAALVVALVTSGCTKEKYGSDVCLGGNDIHNWRYQEDSSCVMMPNAITTNADGINDVFNPVTYWISSMRMIILDRQMHEIFRNELYDQGWRGLRANGSPYPSGTYFYDVTGISTSGREFRRIGRVHVIHDLQNDCISGEDDIRTPDMFDPRRCGFRYPSNDPIQLCG